VLNFPSKMEVITGGGSLVNSAGAP
jgi:hypothetical protein